jgi:hypothetical protein
LLVPFMPAGMRRLYDTASAHDGSEESRKSAREGFEFFFEPWLSSFEDFGVRVKAYQPGGEKGWLEDTLPTTDDTENDEVGNGEIRPPYQFPIFRQRDPGIWYRRSGVKLGPGNLERIKATLKELALSISLVGKSASPDDGYGKDLVKLVYTQLRNTIEGKDGMVRTETNEEEEMTMMKREIARYLEGLARRVNEHGQSSEDVNG